MNPKFSMLTAGHAVTLDGIVKIKNDVAVNKPGLVIKSKKRMYL
jgi:hypothetical protein